MKALFPYLAGGLIALLCAFVLWPDRPEPPSYTRVIVKREVIEAAEPDTVVRWLERVRVVTPPPQVVAIAPRGATELVANFCAPSLRVAAGDTTRGEAARLLLRSFELDRGWLFRTDRLTMTGPTSHGDLVQATYRTRGDVSAVTVRDSLLVRFDRWQLAKDGATAAFLIAVGYYGGRLLP